MSLFLHVLIMQRVILSVCTLSAPTTMPDDGKFISEIGNLFGRAIKQLAEGEPRPADADAVIERFAAPEQKLTPREADRKEHGARTEALAGAIQSWTSQVCKLDETQQGSMKDIVAKSLQAEAERYAKTNDGQREGRPFGDTAPILFVQPLSIGSKFSRVLIDAIRDKVLNESQRELLRLGLEEREEFQLAAFRQYVVSLVDRELYLTEEQRSRLLEHFLSSSKKITIPFYSFLGQSYYLPYQPISGVLQARKADFLDQRQKDRLKDLSTNDGNGNQGYIVFQTSEGPEQWAEAVRNAIVTQRETYLHATAVRIGYLERTLNLTPEQVAYLTVAGKGAATDAIADWKVSTQNTIDQMQAQMAQMGQNFGFSAQNISIDQLDSNDIWLSAVRKLDANNRGDDRRNFIQRAKADVVLALLDQELWLTPQQRTKLLELTKDSVPRGDRLSPWDQYVRELLLLVHPLHKVKIPKVNEVLNESQQAVWKELKAFFRIQQGNNIVEIQLKNQGGSFQVPLNE